MNFPQKEEGVLMEAGNSAVMEAVELFAFILLLKTKEGGRRVEG